MRLHLLLFTAPCLISIYSVGWLVTKKRRLRVHAELVKQPIAANVFRSETEVLEGAGPGNLARVDFRDSGQPLACTDKLADSDLAHPRSHLP